MIFTVFYILDQQEKDMGVLDEVKKERKYWINNICNTLSKQISRTFKGKWPVTNIYNNM